MLALFVLILTAARAVIADKKAVLQIAAQHLCLLSCPGLRCRERKGDRKETKTGDDLTDSVRRLSANSGMFGSTRTWCESATEDLYRILRDLCTIS